MRYGHVFRRDGVNHVVLTKRERIHRDRSHVTVCAKYVDQTFQRRTPRDTVAVAVTCPPCRDFMTVFLDVIEGVKLPYVVEDLE